MTAALLGCAVLAFYKVMDDGAIPSLISTIKMAFDAISFYG